jgi:predicted pyridoxine 5'-phosphate oxidase superfamily flavin-nucleotide-binding protein
MGHRFSEIVFTDSVKKVQETQGSRDGYAKWQGGEDRNETLGPEEAAFIAARDSFYMATVSETGWPYVQHRGGPVGFLRVLDEKTIGFADFRGNRQYVSVGNLAKDDRVSLFLMDYPNKKRLKLLGRVRLVEPGETEVLDKLDLADYRARVERGFVVSIEAFDWNCPQHITPRLTLEELEPQLAPFRDELARLKAENERLKATLETGA